MTTRIEEIDGLPVSTEVSPDLGLSHIKFNNPFWGGGKKMSRIEEIRERERKATRGPWQIPLDTPYQREERGNTVGMLPPFHWHNDLMTINEVRFLDHAREDIPYLLSEVERLEKIIAEKWNLEHIGKLQKEHYEFYHEVKELRKENQTLERDKEMLLRAVKGCEKWCINLDAEVIEVKTCRDAGLLKEGGE